MAVFEIISNPVDTQESLQNLCQYILDTLHEKSDGTLIGGQYLNPTSSFEEMREAQTLFDKDSGRLAYHFIISFDPGDPLMPEDAFTFAMEFIAFFFKEYQVLFNVHTKQSHLHVHLALNPVSLRTGKKLHVDYELTGQYRDFIQKNIELY